MGRTARGPGALEASDQHPSEGVGWQRGGARSRLIPVLLLVLLPVLLPHGHWSFPVSLQGTAGTGELPLRLRDLRCTERDRVGWR
jgi:hypothetical protein